MSCSTSKIDSSHACDVATFHYYNESNDTSKVCIKHAYATDTTICIIHGYVVDRKTSKPIKGAIVVLQHLDDIIRDTTSKTGEFEVSHIEFRGNEWNLQISSQNHICLKVNKLYQFESWGEIDVEFKLQKG